jgi:hypothetical protein
VAGIFISYRWSHASGEAGRLWQDLVSEFGTQYVLIDVESFSPGATPLAEGERLVGQSEVVVCVVHPGWATLKDRNGRKKLRKRNDPVRAELAAALKWGLPIIVVRVKRAGRLRRHTLAPSLASLADGLSIELRHDRWRDDVRPLVSAIRRMLPTTAARVCLRRLQNVLYARNGGLRQMVDDEKWYLGAEADRYRELIERAGEPANDHRLAEQFLRSRLLKPGPVEELEAVTAGLEQAIRNVPVA